MMCVYYTCAISIDVPFSDSIGNINAWQYGIGRESAPSSVRRFPISRISSNVKRPS